ncbi:MULTISPECIES: hypothetical protein [unclassified Streptomyces]|uniref:hypothetical protein n=1 Tax=unclassified Streptomyces TaxID=2593676 RepID=UPI00114D3050|nr:MULTISPECIES: hypothetical protein [unclassified Streptomyces]MYS22647.1 hypothetical protein [Streptomyces sp. SID4948]
MSVDQVADASQPITARHNPRYYRWSTGLAHYQAARRGGKLASDGILVIARRDPVGGRPQPSVHARERVHERIADQGGENGSKHPTNKIVKRSIGP